MKVGLLKKIIFLIFTFLSFHNSITFAYPPTRKSLLDSKIYEENQTIIYDFYNSYEKFDIYLTYTWYFPFLSMKDSHASLELELATKYITPRPGDLKTKSQYIIEQIVLPKAEFVDHFLSQLPKASFLYTKDDSQNETLEDLFKEQLSSKIENSIVNELHNNFNQLTLKAYKLYNEALSLQAKFKNESKQ